MPKRKVYDDFWRNFEARAATTGLNSEIPESVKKLLTLSGYSSTWSFKSLTKEKLSDAEIFIEQHYRTIADEFEEYVNIKPFKFLPGHNAMIFGIKLEIDEFQESKRLKKNPKVLALNERDLQTNLLQQMSTFTKRFGLNADWSNSVQELNIITTENTSFGTCTLLCPLCRRSFVLRYETYWTNSNICKHLRETHLKKQLKSAEASRSSRQKIMDTTNHDTSESFEEVFVTNDLENDALMTVEEYVVLDVL